MRETAHSDRIMAAHCGLVLSSLRKMHMYGILIESGEDEVELYSGSIATYSSSRLYSVIDGG